MQLPAPDTSDALQDGFRIVAGRLRPDDADATSC